ncbi:TrmB family transcriptional regulator [[Eubacterium] cellulosolvens]
MVLDTIPTTKEELYTEFRLLADKLSMLGLSPYEARAYIALVAHGYGNAEVIATTAQIPRTSSYKILQALEDKGFAIGTQGRPKIFKPEPPGSIYEKFKNDLEQTFKKLTLLHEIVHDRGMPQLIFTIAGKDKVLEKIGELLDMSTTSFMVSTPSFSSVRDKLQKKFQNAVVRGVKITIITGPTQGISEYGEVIHRKGLLATDVISDNKQALIAAPDLSACGYTDNELLSKHLQDFLEIMLKH